VALALVVARALPAQAPRLRIGEDNSSARALRQPATLVVMKSSGTPWLTRLDAGAVYALRAGGLVPEIGMRVSAGSARRRADRILGASLRGDASVGGLGLVVSAEYEADGGFDLQKGLASAELTPIGWGAAGLGRFTGHRVVIDTLLVPDSSCGCGGRTRREEIRRRAIGDIGLRWRPWIGAGFGHVFAIGAAPSREDSSAFFRAWGRIEAQLRVPVGAWIIEGDLTGTSWYVDGFHGNNFAKASLSLELGASGVSLTASALNGRRPPRFGRVEEYALGLGYRLPAPAR
jgi:hypothetical protein